VATSLVRPGQGGDLSWCTSVASLVEPSAAGRKPGRSFRNADPRVCRRMLLNGSGGLIRAVVTTGGQSDGAMAAPSGGDGCIRGSDSLRLPALAMATAAEEPWHGNCPASQVGEQVTMSFFWNTALLSAALIVPIAVAPTALRADDHKTRTYHDAKNNDDHQWNSHEDQAYRAYTKENHRKYGDFSKLNANDQQAYWGWRHEHSDALLKIEIR
jgi:hypothetical protein